MSSVSAKDQAVEHIKNVFDASREQRQAEPLTQEQVAAIKTLVSPNNEHFCMKFLDAAGVTEYPETLKAKRAMVDELLEGYLENGNAPAEVRDYALNQMARMMTVAHVSGVNDAFGWAPVV